LNHIYTPIKVIIADDHELIRKGLCGLLKDDLDIEVIDEASDGEELVQLTRKHLPDVVLTDVKMKKMDGVEATNIIKNEFPYIGVVALSVYDEESLIIDMISAGAKGYLLKDTNKAELADAIKTVFKGRPYYSNHSSERIALLIAKGGEFYSSKATRASFTSREMDVIQNICEGLPSKQIAGKLGLTTRTIERYRDAIMRKMKVHNSASVVMYAILNKLFKNKDGSK
jgi:DNA-binding NarL/FixJ family response regulator